jgi:DNA-binding NtrC family response regulator
MSSVEVLLVDDERPFVATMTKRLTRRYLRVLNAFSGQEALERLEKHANVDVVVLDVKMEGMDGIDTLRAIKKQYPLVEVIMLTGHATVDTAIEGMRLGAYDYLMKPCDIEQLVAKIHEAKAKKSSYEERVTQARMMKSAPRHGE